MSENRWDRVARIFSEASELDAENRDSYLQQECGDDVAMLSELQDLLICHESTEDRRFEEVPRASIVAKLEDAVPTADPFTIGAMFGPYRVKKLIGRGGSSDVYLAERTSDFEQTVAIKVLRRQHGFLGPTAHQRFEIERQVLADLHHDSIAKILDGGTDSWGRPFLVMEYASGGSLISHCDRNRLGIRERVELFRKVCEAVGHAHSLGIVHRDIKPSNILVDEHSVPKLVDFGIAKLTSVPLDDDALHLTQTGLIPMTPYYASPEQARGEPVGLASDVYSLGVVCYELLTGRRPYDLTSMSPQQIERTICSHTPSTPSSTVVPDAAITSGSQLEESGGPTGSDVEAQTGGPSFTSICRSRSTSPQKLRRALGDLDNVVLMAMRKDPSRRYRSASDMAEDLTRYLDGKAVVAGAESWAYRFRTMMRQNAVPVVATGLILTSLVAALIVSSVALQRERVTALELQAMVYAYDIKSAFRAIQERDFDIARAIYQRNKSTAVEGGRGLEWAALEKLSRHAEPKILGGHEKAVKELTLVPGKPWAITVGDDDQIIVWDIEVGERVHTLKGDGPFASVAVSPDGRYLATGQETAWSGDEVVTSDVALWDLTSREQVAVVATVTASIEALAFSPDGKKLAIGPRYDPMVVVSIPNGEVLDESDVVPAEDENALFSRYRTLKFLKDGRLVRPVRKIDEQGVRIDFLQVWDRDLAGPTHSFELGNALKSFAISADESILVATDDNLPVLGVFELETGKLLCETAVAFGNKRVAISADGQQITVGYGDGIMQHWRLQRIPDGRDDGEGSKNDSAFRLSDQGTIRAHKYEVGFIVFTENGNLLTCGGDGLVKVWPAEVMSELSQTKWPSDATINKVRVGSSGHVEFHGSNHEIHISTSNSDELIFLPPSEIEFSVSGSSSDGSKIAFGGRQGTLEVVNAAYDEVAVWQHGSVSIMDVQFSPDDQLVAATGNNRWTTVWELGKEEYVHRFKHNVTGTAVAFSPDGSLLACGGHDFLEVYDVRSGEQEFRLQTNSRVQTIDWHDGGNVLASGHTNGEMLLHEVGEEYTTTALPRHRGLVAQVLFVSDNRMVSCSQTSVRMWNVSKKLDLGTIDFRSLLDEPDELAGIAGVAVSPDQANLLVVFNIPNRTRILELPMTISDMPEPNRQPQ